ncbi:D-Ala-D-Ala carboxypeptidase family metallohydrolase [Thalassospira sp. MCCC 1A01428]|uniref:D-Ala-D-Ala carboxypeptidase family metallohydrolase n=1 Tax=Thalassospira sp. MCCC 1A01428 TaxID=1470575 RepID=UPI000A1D9246|nr:D-Ala-D-Ala carboxypeptidase family metallohydrolase [Thalassospira sp. MCCC 1A01428]
MSPHDLNLRLSRNFTLREAVRSQTAARKGIDNTPSVELIAPMVRVAEHILEPIRAHAGIGYSPNSFFRCLELNRAIGSKDTSQHIKGEAVDVEVPGISNFDLAQWISQNLDFDQLILECYQPGDLHSGWVHISYVSVAENRREILHYNGKFYARGLP